MILCLLAMTPSPGAAQDNHPLKIGVEMAGSYHLYHWNLPFWSHEPYYQAMADLGAQFASIHVSPVIDHGDQNATLTLEMFKAMDVGMRAHGMHFFASNEDANFYTSCYIDPGRNEFETTDGLHRWDMRMEWLDPILHGSGPTALWGMFYDECDHTQLMDNAYLNNREPPYIEPGTSDIPYMANTHGLDIQTAWQRLLDACIAIRVNHFQGRVPVFAEQLWPDMFPIYARAGWNVTPKALMESLTPVMLTIAMGGALEYQDRTTFNVTVDMWSRLGFPGHSVEALRSALLMSYWIGPELINIENADFADALTHHPDAVSSGGLIRWLDPDHYELTPHGVVARDFIKNYLPAHPRRIDWRNFRPRVAFIRLPDGGWGQPNSPFRDRLLGNRNMSMDAISAEWLKVWPVLTHGVVRAGALSSFNWSVYPEVPDFFVPLDSVTLFDHLVTGPVLDSVQCFIVSGHALSAPTFAAVRARVAAGATCIIARRLYNQFASGALPGKWVIVDDFSDPAIAAALKPFLGPPDVARFRFKDQVVEFPKGRVPDSIGVTVYDRSMFQTLTNALLGLAAAPDWADLNQDAQFDIGDLVFLVNKFQ